jgi:hypothetical protein
MRPFTEGGNRCRGISGSYSDRSGDRDRRALTGTKKEHISLRRLPLRNSSMPETVAALTAPSCYSPVFETGIGRYQRVGPDLFASRAHEVLSCKARPCCPGL